jgi:hypothetical protein
MAQPCYLSIQSLYSEGIVMTIQTPQSQGMADLATYRRRQEKEHRESAFSKWGAFVIGALAMLTIIAFVIMNYLIRSGDVADENAVKLGGTLEHSSTVRLEY